jgi:lipopolysaccharide export system permease protein
MALCFLPNLLDGLRSNSSLILLERYIFKKAMIAVAIVIAALSGVVWVVRAVQEVDIILSKGQGIFTYLQMISLGVPTLIAAVAPLALMIGLIQTINGLNEESEMVVMHASGASRLTLFKPFLAASLLVALLVYFLAIFAAPYSMATLRSFVTEVRADLVSVIVREGRFQDVGGNITFHVGERAPGGILKSVLIMDARNKKETFTYLAQEGVVSKVDENTFLVLNNGQIQRQTEGAENLSIIRFNSYAFNLSSFSSGKSGGLNSPVELSTAALMNPDTSSGLYKRNPGRFRAELHTRLISGLYPIMVCVIVLAFLGAPSSHRQSHLIVVAAASTTNVVLRGITIVIENGMASNPNLIYVAWAIPVIAIICASLLIFNDKSLISQSLQAKIEAAFEAGVTRSAAFWTKYVQRSKRVEVSS